MTCSCIELEVRYGDTDCKCVHYRERFPNCACEQESVSEHSPGPVEDGEVLVRTLFRRQQIDSQGRLKPSYFRPDPPARGFSVDRLTLTESSVLAASKKDDPRYDGYLMFIAAQTKAIKALTLDNEKRLFCVYDSATVENKAHADVCQNVYIESGVPNRRRLMMEIAWQLRHAFDLPQSYPRPRQ